MELIKVNSQTYELHWVTGKIEEAGKNLETKVSGGGGGGFTYRGTGGTAPVSIKSKTVVHDQIFITEDNGHEHSFQLQDFNIACRNGNRASVLWAIKPGRKSGPYIAVLNHSTGQAYYDNKGLQRIFRRPVVYLLILVVFFFFIGRGNHLFYWMIPVAIIYWLVEGIIAANRFRNNLDMKRYS